MHHKRRRQKNRRAGCLMCKPWKISGTHEDARDSEKFSDHKRRQFARIEAKEHAQ